jgi:replicative DNA helicase
MSYLDTLELLKQRKDNEFNGIPTSFGTLKKVLPTWDQRDSIIVSASTGVGKTSFVWRHAVLDVVDFLKNNPLYDAHIYYLSLELNKHELYFKLFTGLLEEEFQKPFTRDYLLGYAEKRLTDKEYYFLEEQCSELLIFIDKKVTIIDTATTPNRILGYLSEKIPTVNKPDPYFLNIIITDTTNALSSDSGESKMQTIKKWNQDYALKVFRNEKACLVINIQQQDLLN